MVGASVIGPTHIRDGLPNQDAIGWHPPGGRGDALVVVVSDGHGARPHFRSGTGSALAVQVALDAGRAFLESPAPPDELPARIVDGWRAAVAVDLRERPFTDTELEVVELTHGGGVREAVEEDPLIAYGATLIAAIVDGPSALVLQLGDGDVLHATPAGVSQPLPADPRLYGGMTTSLCMPDAVGETRMVRVTAPAGEGGVLVMATDGFKNAYLDDASFLQVGPDIARAARAGPDGVAGQLGGWLAEAARHSGDDVSVAVIGFG
ncbi:MAG TPA: PP2C family serine/threonine-protein phosphatase [Acidimicrobiia bacterium]|nr:PP2C family serine/threonine-protein phosphatase [Acidimicrobiia bacterium]